MKGWSNVNSKTPMLMKLVKNLHGNYNFNFVVYYCYKYFSSELLHVMFVLYFFPN